MKPFLKWAGSKYRIVDRIKAVLPGGKRLIEPFAGSAAVFLNTTYPDYLLADTNGDLINLKYRGNQVTAPVWVMPGHPDNSVTLHFGYGRSRAGRDDHADPRV